MMNPPRYLNTDLEIDSREDMTPLVKEFGEDVFVMYNGEWGKNFRCSFEVNESMAHANEAISYFSMLIESLSKESQKLWDSALKKVFAVGFESGSVEKLELDIEPYVLERAAKLGAKLTIVVYPDYDKDT